MRMPRCQILLGRIREEIFENPVSDARQLYDADCACMDIPDGICESCLGKQEWKPIEQCEKENCKNPRLGINPVCEGHFEDLQNTLNHEYFEIVADCDSCALRPPVLVKNGFNICSECAPRFRS